MWKPVKRVVIFFALFLCLAGYSYGQYETKPLTRTIREWARYDNDWVSLSPLWMLAAFPIADTTKMQRWGELSEFEKRHWLLAGYHKYSVSL